MLLTRRWMFVLAAVLSGWAAGAAAGGSGGAGFAWRLEAPAGPSTPLWLDGGSSQPAAGEPRRGRTGGGGDGDGAALVWVEIAARTGRRGAGVRDGAVSDGHVSAGPGGRWTRGPPRG